jgi:hypothetical protein
MTDEEKALRDLQARLALEAEQAAREAARQRRQAWPIEFVYDREQDAFWDITTMTLHPDRAVDASIPQERWRVVVEQQADEGEPRQRGRPRQRRERLVPPSKDIMRVENDQIVEGSTYWPGKDRIIHDVLVKQEGIESVPGTRILNLYTAPRKPLAEPAGDPTPWTNHAERVIPDGDEREALYDYLAHLVQRPEQKPNF